MKNIVILGGGTGLSALLKGAKYIDDINLSAIVTVADSGGSTGILSKHFDIPAVGDLRRVIAALSRNREELEKSMEFRISGTNTGLDGHTVGNLILISQILMKKNFSEGIEAATKMLNISGTIIPVSNEFNNLNAKLEDGTLVSGEANIGHSNKKITKVFYGKAKASKKAVDAILEADVIIFGIGSLFTSLIANLIYPQIQAALKTSKAKIVYFANVFTQPGETDNFTLKDHITAIEKHTHSKILDKIIVSNTLISKKTLKTYADDDQHPLKIDYDDINYHDLISEHIDPKTGLMNAKHDEVKIKNVIEKILEII